jgi:hypothetical protein
VTRVAAEAQERSAGHVEKREALVLNRDATQRRLEVAMDAATETGASARAWSVRITALRLELEQVEVEIAT